jgi:hypothetical protein
MNIITPIIMKIGFEINDRNVINNEHIFVKSLYNLFWLMVIPLFYK